MNAANFHEYLKNPSMLHQVSYQELKSLALQYPYAGNLRYLMYIKSLLDHNRDHDRNLALASLGSIDRRKLRQLTELYKPTEELHENFSLEEDFLELKDLSTLEEIPVESATAPIGGLAADVPLDLEGTILEQMEKEEGPLFAEGESLDFLDEVGLEEGAAVGEIAMDDLGSDLPESGQEQPAAAVEPVPELEDLLMEIDDTTYPDEVVADLEDEVDEIIEEEFSLQEILAQPMLTTASGTADDDLEDMPDEAAPLEDLVGEIPPATEDAKLEIADDEEIIEHDLEDIQPAPSPASWLNRVKPAQKGFIIDDLSELPPGEKAEKKPKPEKKKKKKTKKKDKVKEVATKSILEDSDIATETLATILERQGHYDKAIAMYERLQLKFPEKSSFFAAKIEALHKKK